MAASEIGMTHKAWSVSVRFALAMVVALPAVAGAMSGAGSLAGTSKLAVKGCGRLRAEFSGTLLVAEGGTWSVQVTGEETFAGTYTPLGRSGRKIRLALDDPSTAALVASVAEDIAGACELPAVTVTSVNPKVLTLALDRKLTKAKLVVRYAFKGNAGGRTGTATYKVIGRGPWTPA
jgi:hypothetical protein